jgi:hypothetical protein
MVNAMTTASTTDPKTDVDASQPHAHKHAGPAPRSGDERHGVLPPAAASGSVAIDIGPGRGALVLYPSERFRCREIEISRVGGHGDRVHTGVHDRTTESQSLLTAIFGSLPVGEYVVWEDATTQGPVVTVLDGAVAEVRLS